MSGCNSDLSPAEWRCLELIGAGEAPGHEFQNEAARLHSQRLIAAKFNRGWLITGAGKEILLRHKCNLGISADLAANATGEDPADDPES